MTGTTDIFRTFKTHEMRLFRFWVLAVEKGMAMRFSGKFQPVMLKQVSEPSVLKQRTVDYSSDQSCLHEGLRFDCATKFIYFYGVRVYHGLLT
jgi:hypothetical protein